MLTYNNFEGDDDLDLTGGDIEEGEDTEETAGTGTDTDEEEEENM
ncbi:MAG: hypothetical protein WC526_00390 [Patescibacteria group bacterium]